MAAATIALVVAVVTAIADAGAALPTTTGALFLIAGAAFHLRDDRHSALATSAVVVGGALLVVGIRAQLHPTGDDLDLFLTVAGGLFVAVGVGFDERRLVSLGLLQWALVLVQPGPDAAPFRHCLIATEVAVPVPRIDPLLLLGLAAVVAGSVFRFTGWRLEAGRGAEVTGLVVLELSLLAKAVELPDLPVLCGAGRGIDPGWLWLAIAVSVAAGVYGAAGRDPVWAGVGAGGLALAGLLGTALSGEARWAVVALLPLLATLVLADRAGVDWPREPGYGRRRPWRRP
ncbi:MAG: hypothetical protein R3343_09660 [Nitriliruptorales bacterium]|nr:hypothetical protein [Nitriliruptorales bacterium]